MGALHTICASKDYHEHGGDNPNYKDKNLRITKMPPDYVDGKPHHICS